MRGLSSARCLRAIVLFPALAMIALGHCATGPKPCWYMHGGRFTRIYGDAVGPEEWRFLAEPGAAGLLRTLPEACRDRALAGCLMRVINAAAPPEPIIEACRELGSDPSEFAAEVAFIPLRIAPWQLVRGDYMAAEETIASASSSGEYETSLQLVLGMIQAKKGDFAAALAVADRFR